MSKKITKPTLILMAMILMMTSSVCGQNREKLFFDNLERKLNQYNRNYYNEKAYLATDRFVYRPGEDLWFHGYVTSMIGPVGDSSSADFYIKFINSKGDEIVSRRYPLTDNQVSGRLQIPRTSIPGKYYLLAYTGWMKNQDPSEAFRKEILIGKNFDKRFQVEILYDKLFYYPGDSVYAALKLIDPSGKPVAGTDFDYGIESFSRNLLDGSGRTDERGIYRLKEQIPASEDILMLVIELKTRKISGEYSLIIPAAGSMAGITFHPEDGNLVQGMDNQMFFRSMDQNGLPVSITGEIIDSRGNSMMAVNSDNMGVGSFNYRPPGDTCFLRITKPEGVERHFPLPIADPYGTKLHLCKLDTAYAYFQVRSTFVSSDTILYCVAVWNRQITWKQAIRFDGKAELILPLAGLQPGIMQVSVFNGQGHVMADRILYLPREKPAIRVKTDRMQYQSRQRVFVTIDYPGETARADLSLAVSLRQMALNPTHAGFSRYVSAYPFDTVPNIPVSHVPVQENLLLSSGYRQISWPEVLGSASDLHPYQRQDGLTGIITDKKENAAQHAKVRVTHIPNFRLFETQTNENGKFQILFGTDVIDFNYLDIEAYDALGKINLVASINQDYSVKLREGIVEREENRNKQLISNAISFNDPRVIYSLRYGSRKFRKPESEIRKRYDPNEYADYTSVLDIIQEIKPFEIRNNMIAFPDSESVAHPGHTQEGVIVVINGMLKGTHTEVFRNLPPSDVTNINVSTSLNDVHRYTPINFQGVIEITTIQGMYRYRQPGFQMGMDLMNNSREFYSPDYSIESQNSSDNRRTLYWNPQLSVYRGQPLLLTFFTSDIRGMFYGKIEGIDAEGQPVEASFSILVE